MNALAAQNTDPGASQRYGVSRTRVRGPPGVSIKATPLTGPARARARVVLRDSTYRGLERAERVVFKIEHQGTSRARGFRDSRSRPVECVSRDLRGFFQDRPISGANRPRVLPRRFSRSTPRTGCTGTTSWHSRKSMILGLPHGLRATFRGLPARRELGKPRATVHGYIDQWWCWRPTCPLLSQFLVVLSAGFEGFAGFS